MAGEECYDSSSHLFLSDTGFAGRLYHVQRSGTLVFACFLTLLAVVLVGTLLWQKRRCRMEAVQGNDVAELGETAAARFRLVNDGILPAAQMVIRYQVYECRTPSKKEKKKDTASDERPVRTVF